MLPFSIFEAGADFEISSRLSCCLLLFEAQSGHGYGSFIPSVLDHAIGLQHPLVRCLYRVLPKLVRFSDRSLLGGYQEACP